MNNIKTKLSFKKIFSPPDFGDDKAKTFRSGLIHTILIFGISAISIYIIFSFAANPIEEISNHVFLMLFYLIVLVGIFIANLNGRVIFSSAILILSVWLILVVTSITAGGTKALAFPNLFLPLLMASVLYGSKVLKGIFVFILLTIYGVYYLEVNQLLNIIWIEHTPFTRWAGGIAFYIVISSVIFLTISRIEDIYTQLRNEINKRKTSEKNIKNLNEELIHAYNTTLEGWARALELRDKETEGHSQRVTELAINFGNVLGLPQPELQQIRFGALLHDIGKMGIPDEILNKPSKLTADERKIIEQHPGFAYDMLKDIYFLKEAITIPCHHHERWDGTGYPEKLKGDEIPLKARMFTLVDNWDALNSDRPYRSAWKKEEVVEYIRINSGKIFDPELVEVFINLVSI